MMTRNQIISVLRDQGIFDGRSLDAEEHIYRENQTRLFVVANAQIFTTRHRILKRADIHLELDAGKLTIAAHVAGENLYVLPLCHPLLRREGSHIERVLRDALWWTRIYGEEDQDCFAAVDSGSPRLSNRVPLNCLVGRWKNQSAYSLDFRGNPEWGGLNMGAASVELFLPPPEHLRRVDMKVKLVGEPSLTRGRLVRPVMYQSSGPLKYVWFSHRMAVPAVLYDNSIALLGNVGFSVHCDREAIHVHQTGRLIGFIRPARIYAPEVVANAQRELDVLFTRGRSKHPPLSDRGGHS